MYMRKLRASDWLKTSVFFMQHECKILKRQQTALALRARAILLSLKNLLMHFNTKLRKE